eukprot:2998556-Amphidinium_carterae.1
MQEQSTANRITWTDSGIKDTFASFLLVNVPLSMSAWYEAVQLAHQRTCQTAPSPTSIALPLWDRTAGQLREARSRAVGVDRMVLSKKLYKHLRQLKAERRLGEMTKGGNIFKMFTGRPKLVSTVVDATGTALAKDEIMKALENHLGIK